ncbi:MAG TPA: ABC transporter ATP-binding protein [Verrucomicrobiae bacterium]|nr:ABC transporter ATP-binding protein [Verrucomicrobiae bacterium]
MSLLEIKDLRLEFGSGAAALRALDGMSLSLAAGESLCLVGESGSGKSLTALSIAQLVPCPPARFVGGEILLEGKDTLRMSKNDLRAIRGKVASYVFQDPGNSLNPVFRVGTQIRETLQLHRPEACTEAEVIRLLKLVGIPAPESRLSAYPHQLSGGMQQRVAIAIAIAAQPRLLIADEPTTALDVTIQAQIIDLLRSLKDELGMAILLITHNLGIVGDIADRVAVMYAGQIVESGPTREVLINPQHPYTRSLLNSVPKLGADVARLTAIPGTVPQLGAWPGGCRFHPRCPIAQASCRTDSPALREINPGHQARCPFGTASMPVA